MGYFPNDYKHNSCELCKYCGGWLVLKYTQVDEFYEVFMCGNPGHQRAVPEPGRGCSSWTEAPEVALGYYD